MQKNKENNTVEQNDTIAAIATPPGVGGIGIVRVSGADAFAIVLPLLQRPSGKRDLPPSHQLTYASIIDPLTQETIDEALVAFMYAPHTYTREPVVEIQSHGGPLPLQRILRAVLSQGARMANAGEFTMRAFLNGRLDLVQAEAVMDLIESETEAGQRLALQQLEGRLSERIQQARQSVLAAIAPIEASIDFPEEDVPIPQPDELRPLITHAQKEVDALLQDADRGRLYRQGLRTAIIGRPNVGKSSLLNALLRMERAIVTPVAGTTRDTVEEVVNVRGIPLHLIDTAGITPTEDPVEKIGVQRSRQAAESADIILLVFDGSEPLMPQDLLVSHELQSIGFSTTADAAHTTKQSLLIVINKSDKPQLLDGEQLAALWPHVPFVSISTLTGAGLDTIEDAMAEIAFAGHMLHTESVLVTNMRHQEALRHASQQLTAARDSLARNLPLDFVSIDLRAAYEALGEVTGETASDDLLDQIFSKFCIGK
jgi:tRNA modification GTPase